MKIAGKFLTVVTLCAALKASAGPEFIPIQEKAQGQSLGGSALLNDSMYSNPAASAFSQVYSIDGTYFMPKSFSFSVLDTQSSSLGGLLGYYRRSFPGYVKNMQGLKLGLMSKVSETVAVGVMGKALWGPDLSPSKSPTLRPDHAEADKALKDIDIGVLTNFAAAQFGVTVRNVFGGEAAVQQSREWVAGARFNYESTLFVSVAATSDWKRFAPYQYGFGAEYVSPYYFAIKGGYRMLPDTGLSYWSAGASFISPRVSFHYAVEFPRLATEALEHVVGANILF